MWRQSFRFTVTTAESTTPLEGMADASPHSFVRARKHAVPILCSLTFLQKETIAILPRASSLRAKIHRRLSRLATNRLHDLPFDRRPIPHRILRRF